MAVQADFDVGVIGAGFGGLIAALELKRSGRRSFVVFERAGEVGGVWRENVYPGCACDIPSALYSIASRPNPGWSSTFASQPEILAYLHAVADQDGLKAHIRFGCEVTALRFDERHGLWEVHDARGGVTRLKAVILATGPQSRPHLPDLPGQARFAGKAFHSARWDRSVVAAGTRFAVIGTGASAVQIVPQLAPEAAQVTLFQRTAPWVLPRGGRRVSAAEQRLLRRFPALLSLSRGASYWWHEFIGHAFLGGRVLNGVLAAVGRYSLWRQVRDPAVRRALTPDYRIGCKRVMVSDDFYPAFNRPNVRLVTDPIDAIEAGGVRTADGTLHPADVIVYATGFNVANPDGFLHVGGVGGRVLAEDWAQDGPQAFRGTVISGYPNLAMLLGPNSGLGHSSALHVMESQMSYVLAYLDALGEAGEGAWFDVRPELQASYNVELQKRMTRTVWASGCSSWYLTRGGRNATIFPGLTHAFRRITATFDPTEFVVSHGAGCGADHGATALPVMRSATQVDAGSTKI